MDQLTRDAVAEDLCRTAAGLYARGWCVGTGGNFSATLSADPVRLLLTRSGVPKGTLTPADLIEVDKAGVALPGQSGRPSAEARLHGTIVSLTGAGSVLHTHSVWGTLCSEHFGSAGGLWIRGYEMLKGLSGVTTHEAEVFVPVLPNAQDMAPLARGIEAAFEEHTDLSGLLIAGHGLYAWGRSVTEALQRVEIFEFLLEVVGRRTAFRSFDGKR